MKYLFLFFLSIASLSAFSQTNVYHPFPDSNAIWNEQYNYFDYHPSPMFIEYYSITMAGDTMISGSTYHKLTIPNVEHQNIPPYWNPQYIQRGYVGALRQNTSTKKVYFVPENDSSEILLYDFNLNVGDTIPDTSFCSPITVYAVDSIVIGTNYRKRWRISGPTQPVDVIEGIGGTRGLLNTWLCYIDGFSTNLNCFQQNGTTLFPDSSYSCDVIDRVNEDLYQDKTLIVSPNPIHTSAHIISHLRYNELYIFNAMGECVRRQPVESNDVIVERGSLADGLYYFQLSDPQNSKASRIVIFN